MLDPLRESNIKAFETSVSLWRKHFFDVLKSMIPALKNSGFTERLGHCAEGNPSISLVSASS
jgi:hypothetical protein